MLRPKSEEELQDEILSKPHKFVDGKYVADPNFVGTEYPCYRHRYVTKVKSVLKNGKKIKKVRPVLESVIVKTAKDEAALSGHWYHTPSRALRMWTKKNKKLKLQKAA